MAARTKLMGMLLALIAERRRQPAAQARRDVVGAIVHARDDRGETLSDEQILAHVNILLVTATRRRRHSQATRSSSRHASGVAAADRGGACGMAPGQRRGGRRGGTAEALRSARDLDNFVKETGRLFPRY